MPVIVRVVLYDGRLNFLDTTVIFENIQLNLENFRKPTATDCMTNYSGYLVIAPLDIAPMTSYCPLFGHI